MPALIYQKDNFAAGPQFAIGQSDFEGLIEANATLVDKTEVIQALIDSTDQITLFPRPRRFGKTLLMRMLKCFFEKSAQSKQHLFEPLKIWKAGEKYQAYQGQYPVIYLSFKDIKEPDFEQAYQKFQALIAEVYRYHRSLLESPALDSAEKAHFQSILDETASRKHLENSLLSLSRWLERAYQQKVILLLDEYDSPIHVAYAKNYYQEMIEFMRGLMGAAFKDNTHLYRGVITGILRISKESMFSDLNNLNVYSILSRKYGEYFGFTQEELDLLLEKCQLQSHRESIQTWYNGYQFGEWEIYNPWSIVNCLQNEGELRPYWVNTANNSLVADMLAKADAGTKANLEKLLKDEPIEVQVSEGIVFNTLNLEASALYSFLLFTGYLKAKHVRFENRELCAQVSIPNEEVAILYQALFKNWMVDKIDLSNYDNLLSALTIGDMHEFERLLRLYIESSMSYFDADTQAEKFYHGFILGILVGLTQTHDVRSNRETGFGRADIVVTPKDPTKLGIILEFKRCDSEKALARDAKKALVQIGQMHYIAEQKAQGITQILLVGVSFHGKKIALKSKKIAG